MSKKKIPKQISSVLAVDEVIEKMFDLNDCKVYATDKRLLTLKGRTIKDYDYTHISSIEYSSKRHWGLLVFGIILVFGGVLIASASGVPIALALSAIGFIFIFLAAFMKSEWVEIRVVGVPNPVKYKGSRHELDSLLQIIRQKRTIKHEAPPETRHQALPSETKDVDSIDKIRRLAKLKDDGIISQEEFEQKKNELLTNLR